MTLPAPGWAQLRPLPVGGREGPAEVDSGFLLRRLPQEAVLSQAASPALPQGGDGELVWVSALGAFPRTGLPGAGRDCPPSSVSDKTSRPRVVAGTVTRTTLVGLRPSRAGREGQAPPTARGLSLWSQCLHIWRCPEGCPFY